MVERTVDIITVFDCPCGLNDCNGCIHCDGNVEHGCIRCHYDENILDAYAEEDF